MGNKLGRRRNVVDEKYTKPQGLYNIKEVDHKKLRKLILDSKLAPCYPGDDECSLHLEECPICFMYYPSLNRSKCCMKGICTECFLQMKPTNCNRPTQCPFCKTTNYAVEYRGLRTKEEKGREQVEEQRVIEAQIRMRQEEFQDDELVQKKKEIGSSSRVISPADTGCLDILDTSNSDPSSTQGDELVSYQGSYSASGGGLVSNSRHNRDDNFDLDLEDIMVMEAIWLSIQDHGTQRNISSTSGNLAEPPFLEDCGSSPAVATTEASPPGGLACAIAALAEHHQTMNMDSAIMASSNVPVYNAVMQADSSPASDERVIGSYSLECDSERAFLREEIEWRMDHRSEVTEAGTSYSSSDTRADLGPAPLSLPENLNVDEGHSLPETFEEQMILAMAVSLAEARARMTSYHGLAWL